MPRPTAFNKLIYLRWLSSRRFDISMTLSVAVVGATGYVGRRVVHALASSGPVGLQLFSRNSPSTSTFDLPSDRFHWQRVDAMDMVGQPQKWSELFQGQCKIEQWSGKV